MKQYLELLRAENQTAVSAQALVGVLGISMMNPDAAH